MDNKKSFSLNIEENCFKILENEINVIYSDKLEDTFSPFCNFYEQKKTKIDLKLLKDGKIPDISFNNLLRLNIKNKIYPLFFSFSDIGKAINEIIDFDFTSGNLSNNCDTCDSKLLSFIDKETFKDFLLSQKPQNIYIGIKNWQEEEKFNIKKLIKNGIYYVLFNNLNNNDFKIFEIDEIKNEQNFRFTPFTEKLLSNDIKNISSCINKFIDSKNEKLYFYLEKDKKFLEIDLKNDLFCPNCKKIIKKGRIQKNSEDILNKEFKDIKTNDANLKDKIGLLCDFGFSTFTPLTKIEDTSSLFLLSFINLISKNISKDDIIIIQSPLSFVSKDYLLSLLKYFNKNTIIIFENKEEALDFKNVFVINKNCENAEFDKKIINNTSSLKKGFINILEKEGNKYFNSQEFKKIVNISPLYSQDTFLASFINVFDDIKEIFIKTQNAKKLGITKKDFNLVSKNRYICSTCLGKGVIKNLINTSSPCPDCKGGFYKKEILNLKFKDKTFFEIMNMNLAETLQFFNGFLKIKNKIAPLIDLGLADLKLNLRTSSLTPNYTRMIQICNNFNTLQENILFHIKEGPVFLSNSEKSRLFKTLAPFLKKNTIIFEASLKVK